MDSTKRRRRQRFKINLCSPTTFFPFFTGLHEPPICSKQFLIHFPRIAKNPRTSHPHIQNHYTFHQYLVLFFKFLNVKRRDLLLPTSHVTNLPGSPTCETSVKFSAGYLVSDNRLSGTTKQFPSNPSLNPLKTKRRGVYLKTQFVPRSKHFSSRL